ncbi:hypothetical protein [Cupriavidus sp. TMH.W2]|uniref:hypothetical protein n=1 Tax=Cupriavidus sp. TMH.W2 TaxID=3434465 RepID=UPI003D78402C
MTANATTTLTHTARTKSDPPSRAEPGRKTYDNIKPDLQNQANQQKPHPPQQNSHPCQEQQPTTRQQAQKPMKNGRESRPFFIPSTDNPKNQANPA